MGRALKTMRRAVSMGAAAFTLLLAFNLAAHGLAAPDAHSASPVAAAVIVSER